MPGRDRVLDPISRDYVRDDNGSWKTTRTIATGIYHQLLGRRNQWWGDFAAGSDLYLMEQESNSPGSLELHIERVRSAIRPFEEQGLARDLEVEGERDTRHRQTTRSQVVDVQSGTEIDLAPFLALVV